MIHPLPWVAFTEEKQESRAAPLCRPHLNDPPTAVGGIPGVFHGLNVGADWRSLDQPLVKESFEIKSHY